MDAEHFLAIVQARGSDARDVRDAAHEACHALQWGVTRPWTRDNIHAKKPRDRVSGIRSELLARAVEQLVCAEFAIDCGTVEKWAHVCWMEMLKNERIELPTNGWIETQVRAAMTSLDARRMVQRLLSMRMPRKKKARDERPPQGPLPES